MVGGHPKCGPLEPRLFEVEGRHIRREFTRDRIGVIIVQLEEGRQIQVQVVPQELASLHAG